MKWLFSLLLFLFLSSSGKGQVTCDSCTWESFWQGIDTTSAEAPMQAIERLNELFDAQWFGSPQQSANFCSRVMSPAEASPTVWHALRQRIEEELYSPRQNTYDEELYLPFVQCFLASPLLDDDDRIRYRFQHECLLLNRRGTKANDIRLFKGRKKVWLSEAVEESQADSVLILFFDPQCESCLQTISIMDADERLREHVKSGGWAVVAINTGRKSRYLPAMPREWIILNDKKGETRKAKNYFLRTMPKIYLISKDMTVIDKNVIF